MGRYKSAIKKFSDYVTGEMRDIGCLMLKLQVGTC